MTIAFSVLCEYVYVYSNHFLNLSPTCLPLETYDVQNTSKSSIWLYLSS